MKNNRTSDKDVIFSIEIDKLKSWESEIVDDIYPVHRFVEDIKKKVFVAIDMSTFDKYMLEHPDNRIEFLKKNGHINF